MKFVGCGVRCIPSTLTQADSPIGGAKWNLSMHCMPDYVARRLGLVLSATDSVGYTDIVQQCCLRHVCIDASHPRPMPSVVLSHVYYDFGLPPLLVARRTWPDIVFSIEVCALL